MVESEKIYNSADLYYLDLIQAISESKQSIDLEMYIFALDATGEYIFNNLLLAAERGVRVRVLADGIGSYFWLEQKLAKQFNHNLQIRAFHPFSWGTLFTNFSFLNRRTHRKVIIIDGDFAFVGSINFMDQARIWREAGIRISGESVSLLNSVFENTWKIFDRMSPQILSSSFLKLSKALMINSVVRTTHSLRLQTFYRKDLIRRILFAKQKVWLMTPYFLPPAGLLRVLIKMGSIVDVRLILPSRSDIVYFPWLIKLYYRALLLAGVRVFEFTPSILHAKIEVIDSWVMLGSSNLNHRSFYRDLETDIVLKQSDSIRQIEASLINDMQASKEINLADFEQNYLTIILARIIRLAKRWL
jgi:cardiolipin synthase